MNAVGTSDRPVVVGITGEHENTAALAFAIQEARHRRRPLLLLHAVHDVVPLPPAGMLVEPIPWERIGQAVLDDVRHEVDSLGADGLEVHGTVRSGPPGVVITEISDSSSLVVLQHRSLSRLQRIFTGSTVLNVARDSHCPVISVPTEWSGTRAHGRVTVGVHEDGLPETVLQAAFAQADEHGAAVHLVHAWRIDPAYDDFMTPPSAQWDAGMRSTLENAAKPFAAAHPSVPVEIEVRHQWAADALVELGSVSDLLVVGRHSTSRHLPHRIGAIARTLVRSAPCPVMVVPV